MILSGFYQITPNTPSSQLKDFWHSFSAHLHPPPPICHHVFSVAHCFPLTAAHILQEDTQGAL